MPCNRKPATDDASHQDETERPDFDGDILGSKAESLVTVSLFSRDAAGDIAARVYARAWVSFLPLQIEPGRNVGKWD